MKIVAPRPSGEVPSDRRCRAKHDWPTSQDLDRFCTDTSMHLDVCIYIYTNKHTSIHTYIHANTHAHTHTHVLYSYIFCTGTCA